MRVLHVIPSVAASDGGPSVVLRTLTSAQAAAGADVHVATTDDDGGGRRSVRPVGHVTDDVGVSCHVFPRQTQAYKVSLPLARWLWRSAGEYDVVHIHALFSFASAPAAWAARRHGVPYVVRPLGVLNQWGRQERRPRLKALSFRLIEWRILGHAAAVQWTSEQERLEAADLNIRAPGVIIPNPVDVPTTSGNGRSASRNGHVLFLSRIDEKKGIDILLEAFVLLRNTVPGVTLTVAGGGPTTLVNRLRAQAGALGIDKLVRWTGAVSGAEKDALFDEASLFVLPSRSENFGVAVVEALARGLPVVVSDAVGIHRDVVAAHAGLAVPATPPQLADAMRRYLTDGEERAAAGRAGITLVHQRYRPEAIAAQLTALYQDIIGGKAPQAVYAGA